MVSTSKHLEGIAAKLKSGFQSLGGIEHETTPMTSLGGLATLLKITDNAPVGATLDTPLEPGQGPSANGSVLIFCADTEEEVRKAIEGDVYTQNGVWDMSKMQIIPVSIHKEITGDVNLTDVVQNRCKDSFSMTASSDAFEYQNFKDLIF